MDQIGSIPNGGGPTFKNWLVSRRIVIFYLSLKSWSTPIRVVKMKLVQLGVSPIGGSPIGGSPIGGSPNWGGPPPTLKYLKFQLLWENSDIFLMRFTI